MTDLTRNPTPYDSTVYKEAFLVTEKQYINSLKVYFSKCLKEGLGKIVNNEEQHTNYKLKTTSHKAYEAETAPSHVCLTANNKEVLEMIRTELNIEGIFTLVQTHIKN